MILRRYFLSPSHPRIHAPSFSFFPSFFLSFFIYFFLLFFLPSFVGEGFPGGKEEDLHRLFISGKGGEGSRISSTVGHKIRYRFPSSKLSTRYVWEGRQGTPYGIRGTRPASLVHVPSYVGGNFGRSLASCARTTRCSTTRMHAPRSHRDTHREHTGTGTGTETGSKTCGHLEREFNFAPRCGTMRSRALLYYNSLYETRESVDF